MELTYSTDGEVLILDKEVAMSDISTSDKQMFITRNGCFIYYKDTKKLHEVTIECYFKTLYKIQTLIEEYDDRESKTNFN